MDEKSILLNTRFLEGSVVDSVCTSVTTPSLQVEGCLLMNVTAKKVVGKNCIVYNVVDESEEGLVLPEGTVLTNVFMPGQPKLVMQSTVTTDGGTVRPRTQSDHACDSSRARPNKSRVHG